jgi:hypothetical protein
LVVKKGLLSHRVEDWRVPWLRIKRNNCGGGKMSVLMKLEGGEESIISRVPGPCLDTSHFDDGVLDEDWRIRCF